MFYEYCDCCEGFTYQVEVEMELKNGTKVKVVECEECENFTKR